MHCPCEAPFIEGQMVRSIEHSETTTTRAKDILALARKVYGLRGFAGPSDTVLNEALKADPPLRNVIVLELGGDAIEATIALGELAANAAETEGAECADDAKDS